MLTGGPARKDLDGLCGVCNSRSLVLGEGVETVSLSAWIFFE